MRGHVPAHRGGGWLPLRAWPGRWRSEAAGSARRPEPKLAPDSSDEAKRLFLNCLATTGLRLLLSKITDSTVNELAAKKPVYHHR